ncbi:MAG: cysteine-rich CWC family protein [Chitinophagales bacterium]|nr:cysteine-rich CWC family protein [Chitinophagales bacterium]
MLCCSSSLSTRYFHGRFILYDSVNRWICSFTKQISYFTLSIETKICERCSKSFECNTDNINACQCNISLTQETSAFLSKTKYDCLCADCLNYYNELIQKSKLYTSPTKKGKYIEDVHYYIDQGKWVFTDLYHLQKGYCCQNGCRHCVYGFTKQIFNQ